MKKIILILALLIAIHLETKAQQENQFTAAAYLTAAAKDNTFLKNMYSSTNHGPDKDYNYYIQKSKSQRIVGWVTLGGGIVLSGIGILIASNSDPSVDIYGNVNDSNAPIAAVLTIAGAVSGIVSIPFMIMAGANKQKAKLMLSNQKTGFGLPPNVSKDITGITMTIPLGK